LLFALAMLGDDRVVEATFVAGKALHDRAQSMAMQFAG